MRWQQKQAYSAALEHGSRSRIADRGRAWWIFRWCRRTADLRRLCCMPKPKAIGFRFMSPPKEPSAPRARSRWRVAALRRSTGRTGLWLRHCRQVAAGADGRGHQGRLEAADRRCWSSVIVGVQSVVRPSRLIRLCLRLAGIGVRARTSG